MADTRLERIRPGASVEWTDGHLGHVDGVRPGGIAVVDQQTGRTLIVPADLVQAVGADGSVQLSVGRTEVEERADPGRGGQGRRATDSNDTLQLREEDLVARKELQEAGRISFRKEVQEVPRQLEVEAYHEEVTLERVPIGRVVEEQATAREEDGVYIVPIYEEQLVVVKQLVLKEEIHIRRERTTERRVFEDTVQRERLVVEDPDQTGRVRMRYPTESLGGEPVVGDTAPDQESDTKPQR